LTEAVDTGRYPRNSAARNTGEQPPRETLNGAVNAVRREENKALVRTGDPSLAELMHLLRYAAENLTERYEVRLESLESSKLRTARAWAVKVLLRFSSAAGPHAWKRSLRPVLLDSRKNPVFAPTSTDTRRRGIRMAFISAAA